MADALVELLNGLGYQPVFLPRSGLVPPEIYNVAKGRLVRRGPLADYLPAAATLAPRSGRLADIEKKHTTGKHAQAAASFLEKALRCLGIDGAPKLDLGFTGGKELRFSFSGVTSQSVDPSKLDPILEGLQPGAIPAELIDAGKLHVVYEYAYADTLLMSRADGHTFDADISGKVDQFLDAGVKAKIAALDATTISFTRAAGDPAAFAYKAGRLERAGAGWAFYPEELSRGPGDVATPYLPSPGRVLELAE